jgi:hypothetical protein
VRFRYVEAGGVMAMMTVAGRWMSSPQGIMKTLCIFVFSCRSGAPSRASEGSSDADLACARALALSTTLEFESRSLLAGAGAGAANTCTILFEPL